MFLLQHSDLSLFLLQYDDVSLSWHYYDIVGHCIETTNKTIFYGYSSNFTLIYQALGDMSIQVAQAFDLDLHNDAKRRMLAKLMSFMYSTTHPLHCGAAPKAVDCYGVGLRAVVGPSSKQQMDYTVPTQDKQCLKIHVFCLSHCILCRYKNEKSCCIVTRGGIATCPSPAHSIVFWVFKFF